MNKIHKIEHYSTGKYIDQFIMDCECYEYQQ